MIGYILIKKFNVHIQFGRIKFPFLLRDVKITKKGFYVVGIILLYLYGCVSHTRKHCLQDKCM